MASSSSTTPTQSDSHLFDFGSLNSSTLPDLSLNQIPRLSLELGPTDLSLDLQDISTNPPQSSSSNPRSSYSSRNNPPSTSFSNQLAFDLSRNPSKRWTSFSDLGKSVLKLKPFDRSTVHGSNPSIRPRLVPVKSNSIHSSSSTSNHRNLFKLFNQDPHPSHSSTLSTSSASRSLTLPILPPMSELLEDTTSFDKELNSIVHQPMIIEEPVVTSNPMAGPNDLVCSSASLVQSPDLIASHPTSHNRCSTSNLVEFRSQKAQSVVSSQSAPAIAFVPPSSLSQAFNLTEADQPEISLTKLDPTQCPASMSMVTIAESITMSIGQDPVSKLPVVDQPLETEVTQSERSEEDGLTHQEPVIEILNRSDDSKSHEDPTTLSKVSDSLATPESPPAQNNRPGGILGWKKKSSDGSSLFKLLFLKGFGHLKPGHSSSPHTDASSRPASTSIH